MKKVIIVSIAGMFLFIVIYLLIPQEYKSLYKESRKLSKELSVQVSAIAKELKNNEKQTNLYYEAIELKDINKCDNEIFTPETKIFCKAIVSQDVKYCNELSSIPAMTSFRHAQCIDETIEKMIPPSKNKVLCEGLKDYDDLTSYYRCRAKVADDITECEEIMKNSDKDNRVNLAIFCIHDVAEATKDASLCDKIRKIEEEHGIRIFGEDCLKK